MDSTVELSDDFLMRIFPLSTSTASEKVRTMLLSTATAVALSAGDALLNDGEVVSSSDVSEIVTVEVLPT